MIATKTCIYKPKTYISCILSVWVCMHFTRKAFTLIEIVVATAIISVWLTAILFVLTNSGQFVQDMKLKITALNIAREWVEAIMHIRDTNRHRRSGQKNWCRLKRDPFQDDDNNCTNDDWITSGYTMIYKMTNNQGRYFVASGSEQTIIDPSDGIQENERRYTLCQSNEWWNACPYQTGSNTFLRQIHIQKLINKDTQVQWWTTITCNNGDDCSTIQAMELQFCVYVFHTQKTEVASTLCSLITNFEK